MAAIVADARGTVLHLLPQNARGMEIGVWRGDFSAQLLHITQPRVLHLVDPYRRATGAEYEKAWYGAPSVSQEQLDQTYQSVLRRFAQQIAAEKVVVHRESAVSLLQRFPPNSLDYVYIDGDHTYDAVVKDLANSFNVVRPGGFICGDDYHFGGWWGDGVVRGLHTFLASFAVRIDTVIGNQFVLRKLQT